MDDEKGLMDEMMSNFDNLEDTINDKMRDTADSNTDMTHTLEYSVDVREIKKPHKSRAYKKALYTFRERLKYQLERIQRKKFDSDSSSADETTLDWLERLRGNMMRNRAITPHGDSVNDGEDSEGNGIDLNSLQRYTNLQSGSANIETDMYRGFQVECQDLSESESEPTQRLLMSRRDDEELRRRYGRNAEKEQRMVTENVRSLDSSLLDERKGGKGQSGKGKQVTSMKECELKRVVRVKDQGSKTLRLYQKHEMDQNENLTTKKEIEIVEDKHESHQQGTTHLQNASAKRSVPAPLSKQKQAHKELTSTSGTIEESEDTDELLSHVQQLYSSKPDKKNLAVRSRDIDERALMDETEAEEGNSRRGDDVPSGVKMFGKINGGKRRFPKRAHRRAHLQATSSSSDNDSKDSLDKMLKNIKMLKKQQCESSSSTDATSSLLRRQTVRFMKRLCKRSRETSEIEQSGGANDFEDTVNGATTQPRRKRPKRSTSPDIEVEETVEAHIKKIGKGSTYTRRYFQKRHRIKRFGKEQDKKETRCGAKRCPVADVNNGLSDHDGTDAGPSRLIQSDKNPLSADDRPLLISNEPTIPDRPQGKQDSHQTSTAKRSLLSRSNPQKISHEGRTIRLNETPSFFLLPKDQANPPSSMQTTFKILSVLVIFVFLIIAMSFLIRFLFVCNPDGRCYRCDIEFALYKFIDSHSELRHMKRPPI